MEAIRTRRRRRPNRGVAGVLALGAIGATTILAPPTQAASTPTMADHTYKGSLPNSNEALPSYINIDRMDSKSVQFLSQHDETRHWSITSNKGEVCLVSELMATQTAGLTCVSENAFSHNGIALQLGNDEGEDIEVHLIPDGYTTHVEDSTGWDRIAPNLFASDPHADAKEDMVPDDGIFAPEDLKPIMSLPTREYQSERSNATPIGPFATIQYANGTVRQGNVWISSHPPRTGVRMTGSQTEIAQQFPVHAALVGIEPPHWPYAQANAIRFVRITHITSGPAISRCWFDDNGVGVSQALYCYYST